MKKEVILLISGTQTAPGCAPETIELTTTAEYRREGESIILRYQESPLTGLTGTTTQFTIRPGVILLERHGAVESVMEFVEGKTSESLYRIEEGALLLRVIAKKMTVEIENDVGFFELNYGIEIEDTPMGTIEYHITIQSANQE